MTVFDGESELARVQIEAHADGRARQYIAGRDQIVNVVLPQTPAVAMCTLPRDVAAFTGRHAELQRLIADVKLSRGINIHTVDGMPGVGKTALVTRAAHLLIEEFPDGQLFVNLHSHTPGMLPARPADVLADLLAHTGMASQEIPEGLQARAERWRSRLAGKRVMLILDDAIDHSQIEPLLPGVGECLVLITSRRRLIALEGASPLPVGTLPAREATELFAHLASLNMRTLADIDAAATLTRLCGNLPLAIALLAGRMAHHPQWDITTLAARFAAEQQRLTVLAAGNRAVAIAFEMSYQGLPQQRQRLFRYLGHHPGFEIDAYATAALLGIPLDHASAELDALYCDHLVEEPSLGRYRLHDLIRDYTRILATRNDSGEDRAHAIARLLTYYRYTAHIADRHLARSIHPGPHTDAPPAIPVPTFTDMRTALAWMRTEKNNLLACLDYAATHDYHEYVLAITAAMADFLSRDGHWQQAVTLHSFAVTVANLHRNEIAEANALQDLGKILRVIGDSTQAAVHHDRALALYRGLGDRLGEAHALQALGWVSYETGAYVEAVELQTKALAMYRDLGDRLGEAHSQRALGWVSYETGAYVEAVELQTKALAMYRDLGDRLGEAHSIQGLGWIRRATREYARAISRHEEALIIYRELGDSHGEANSLQELGWIMYEVGQNGRGVELQQRALNMYRKLGARHGEAHSLWALGWLRHETENYEEAGELQEQARALLLALNNPAPNPPRKAGVPRR
ncbi:ATP-binding protein [Nonomuraea sp. NPDC050394]|uniref:ATP-binding protein n=1 Tax=Nonomuraea sp. NPDC050394 TaxID=3364363 RepID=UPI0037B1CAB1